MIAEIISDIDTLIKMIKSKDNSKSFSYDYLMKFEFTFFLTMEIVRYELLTSKKLSNISSDAISQMFAFQCYEFYYQDYPELHMKCSELFRALSLFNQLLLNHDLPGNIGIDDKSWLDYFNNRISTLL